MKKVPINAGDIEILKRIAPNAKITTEAGGLITPSLVQFAHLSFSEYAAFETAKSNQAKEARDSLDLFYSANR